MMDVDEREVADALRPMMADARLRAAFAGATGDPRLLALFVLGLARSDQLCRTGASAVRDETLTRRLRSFRAHDGSANEPAVLMRRLAKRIAPAFFDDGRFRYERSVGGAGYYFSVVQANRVELRGLGKYSRLTLQLTTDFGHGVAFRLVVDALVEAVERSRLDRAMAGDTAHTLEAVVRLHLSEARAAEIHDTLLRADRTELLPEAAGMLDGLRALEPADYRRAAHLAVREMVRFQSVFADRDTVESCLAEGVSLERDTTTVALS